jgi:predicted nucleic acid-binding protein
VSPVEPRKQLRLFLDSNVLTGGIVARWGLDKAVLSLCAAKICRLVLAEAVKEEVEANLLLHAARIVESEAQQLLGDYTGLIKLARPEIVPFPAEKDVLASRRLIAHEADVPVLLSAMLAKPDWLLTHNTKHFTPQVAKKCELRIGSPADFFRQHSEGIS